MRSELMDDMRRDLQAAIEPALTDEILERARQKFRDVAEDAIDSFHYALQANLAEHLAYHVKEMAGRAVEALLEGNEAEMIRWLACDKRGYNGRSDGYTTRRDDEQHPIIHGKLFETGSVLLRKRIAQAHRDLITSERILDLEDQVKSLVAQNNKMERERNEWRDRALGA